MVDILLIIIYILIQIWPITLLSLFALGGMILLAISIPKDLRRYPLYYLCFKYNGVAFPLTYSFIVMTLFVCGLKVPDYTLCLAVVSFYLSAFCMLFYYRLQIKSALENKVAKSEISISHNLKRPGSFHCKTMVMVVFSILMDIAYVLTIKELFN